ncbi:MAG: hypothetical protein IT320_16220 [Anaerolineae bacterium]|nr:hypothetical protein [Anaerolineae bacterium]
MADNKRRSRSGSSNPYRTVSASERRARRKARDGGSRPAAAVATTGSAAAAAAQVHDAIPQDVVNDMLNHPTKIVTEDQLRSEYGYVMADIRNMFLLALGLIVLLVVLALVLPH